MNYESPTYVVAGALIDARGRVLIAQRPPGKALAGRWEFPGGKKLAHETPRDALNRELLEELGIQVSRARPLLVVRHRYAPDAPPVLIDCWVVEQWRGEIAALDGQQLRWCEREELPDADILEADRPIVTALRLPGTFVHVGDPETLVERIPGARGRERAAWLVPALPHDASIVRRLREHGDHVYVLDPHGPPAAGNGRVYSTTRRTAEPAAAGGHLRAGRELLGQVVHTAADARHAAAAGADFLLVPDRGLAPEELAGIADAGLPWYVNVAVPARADAVPATGKLWWKAAGDGRGLTV
jgi:8-oxo-dGTP diphosphatase